MALKDTWVDKINGVDINSAEDINQVAQAVIDLEDNQQEVVKGEDGATFIPSVSANGVISWTNNQNLPNPDPVNIKGEKGDDGYTPVKGTDYFTDAEKAEFVQAVIASLPIWNGGSY